MSRVVIPLLLVLAVGGLVWWLFGGDRQPPPDYDDYIATPERVADGPEELREEGRSPIRLGGRTPTRPARPRPGPRSRPLPPQEVPRGGLLVTPVGPDGETLPSSVARVHVRGVGTTFHAPPLGIPDPDTGVWTFRRIYAGDVRVVVSGEHLVDASQVVEVLEDEVAEVEISVEPGGAIRYKVVLYSGEAPEKATLTLLDHESRRPIRVRYQARSAAAMSTLREATSITQGPEGLVSGIPPGKYWLHATSPEGEFEEGLVEIQPGETVPLEIRVRK